MTAFHTSFEAGHAIPTWTDTVEVTPGGHPKADGATLRTRVGTGPATSPSSRTGVGHTGTHSLRFDGTHTHPGPAHRTNRLFWTDITVEPHTTLSYVIHPDTDTAHHTAIDLAFDDGTYLTDLPAHDHLGFPAHPTGQGASRALFTHQWNHRAIAIGAVATGKRITRILLTYHAPTGPADFAGWIDDLTITHTPTPRPDPVDRVITTRGTHSSHAYSRGNTIPATAVPHGFNFWTPITNADATNWIYEFHRGSTPDNRPALQAIGISHQPSPWMGDRHTFHLMPTTGTKTSPTARALTYTHANQTARPHLYDITFDNGIRTELAPTDHAAILRITYPQGPANLVLDTPDGHLDVHPDGTFTAHTDVRSGLSQGAGRMYIHGRIDHPDTDSRRSPFTRKTALVRCTPQPTGPTTITVRIATSLISPEQAAHNLDTEIAPTDTLDTIRDRARDQWAALLNLIEVDGATDDQLTTLYSCLYRLYLYPNSGYENTPDGPRYASPVTPPSIRDGKIHVNNGFWDTYRTCWPAYALLTPTRCGELADGFLQQYRDGGWVSRWSSPGYANLMTGTSSDVAFADAALKNVPGIDHHDAYAAALRNATVTPPDESVGRKGLEHSIFLHYTPTSTPEGLSWAMEGCVNDHGIANLAAAVGDPDGHAYFLDRARHYTHHFDPRIGFFQGRSPAAWRWTPETYDPRVWGHDYTETNGWTAAFAVPHDVPGLAELHGGPDALADKLDEYFATPETATHPGSYHSVIHEMAEARDVRMGQYGHSNQPAHHIPYLYTELGRPWRTQETVRDVLTRLYQGSEIGQGYLGDEDNGEMSAWYLFSALGFYPLRVGSPVYAIGAPLFPRAVVHLENGNDLVITAANQSHDNKYVQSLHVNGQPHTSARITHDVLVAGARLDFEMGPEPSSWGADDLPAPLADGPPLHDITRGRPGRLFDDTTRTQTTVDAPVVVRVDTPAEVLIYTITSGSDGPDPASWALRGSVDGATWHEIDRRDSETFRWRKQTRPFLVREPGAYRHYSLAIEGEVTVAQIELLAR